MHPDGVAFVSSLVAWLHVKVVHLEGKLGARGARGHILGVSYPEWKLLHDASPIRPGHCDTQQIPAPPLTLLAHRKHLFLLLKRLLMQPNPCHLA